MLHVLREIMPNISARGGPGSETAMLQDRVVLWRIKIRVPPACMAIRRRGHDKLWHPIWAILHDYDESSSSWCVENGPTGSDPWLPWLRASINTTQHWSGKYKLQTIPLGHNGYPGNMSQRQNFIKFRPRFYSFLRFMQMCSSHKLTAIKAYKLKLIHIW